MRNSIFLALLLACGTTHGESIPLIHEHGANLVPVLINDKISLNFTIDSGATDVSIPADVFSTLSRTGTVTKSDFLDRQLYELADGSKHWAQQFRIRSLRIGSLELRDVIASVAPSGATLLLGQSFLERIKTYTIDNKRHLLVINELPSSGVTTKPDEASFQFNNDTATWVEVSKSRVTAVYLDTSSIKTTDPIRRAWSVSKYAPHAFPVDGDATRWKESALMLMAFNCELRRERLEAYTIYYSDSAKEKVSYGSMHDIWRPAPPGSAMEDLLDDVCTFFLLHTSYRTRPSLRGLFDGFSAA